VGEECGVDYHFVEESRFKELIAADSFLEHANFSGNWYGTSFEAIERVQRSGHICILDIDLAGVKSIKKHLAADGHGGLDARYVFVRPPEKGHLEGRLRARGTETDDSLARRLARVDADFEYAAVPGNYNLILVNDDLEAAYLRLVSFIFRLQ
jgi:guanylate kinase